MAQQPAIATQPQVDPLERETIRRIAWRLMPLLMLGYFCAYLDRVNVGFAGLTMNKALGFSAAVFGFGSGVFFVGYFLFEIPSNLILDKVGARRWIARILLTWGIISALTAFVWNDWSFYTVRFLLGAAEAGFYPGIVLYLTWWFPSYYRSRMMGIFQSASVISLIVGPIVSSQLLVLDGWLGLAGWQWLFIIEALPPIIMSVVVIVWLTDRPSDALWLRPDQRDLVADTADARAGAAGVGAPLRTRRDAAQPARLVADPGVFRPERVELRTADLPAADHQGIWRVDRDDRRDQRRPLRVCRLRDDLLGLPFGPAWRTHQARGGGLLRVCRGAGACIFIGIDHPTLIMVALDHRHHGAAVDRTDVLVPADGDAVRHRGSRRNRA